MSFTIYYALFFRQENYVLNMYLLIETIQNRLIRINLFVKKNLIKINAILSHRVIILVKFERRLATKDIAGRNRKSEQRKRGKRVNANEYGEVTTLIKARRLPLYITLHENGRIPIMQKHRQKTEHNYSGHR